MAETGNLTGLQPATAYQQSFGSLPHDSCYQNPYGLDTKSMAVDERDKEEGILGKAYQKGLEKFEMKAHTISGLTANTGDATGLSTIPVYLDPRIVDVTRKWTPLVELVPRVSCSSNVYTYNTITAKGGASALAEDAALNETNTTYARSSTKIKYLYAVGRVTGPAIAAQPSFVLEGMTTAGASGAFGSQAASNAKQQEVLVKTREMRELQEELMCTGDATTYPNQYDGIVQLMSATNTVDKNTSALSLSDIDTAIQYAFDDGGRPNLAVCSSAVFTDLLGLLTAKIGYMTPTAKVFWGFSTIVLNTMVGEVPVIPSMYLSNTSGSKCIYFLDMSVVHMAVLQDLTYFDLAKTNDSEKFALKCYEAMVIRRTAFCSSITEIS
jgi:hypothetical protein